MLLQREVPSRARSGEAVGAYGKFDARGTRRAIGGGATREKVWRDVAFPAGLWGAWPRSGVESPGLAIRALIESHSQLRDASKLES